MIATNHYHERIQRATERLAQLQARELLASQRQASKAKQAQRQEEARRRRSVASLVYLAGAEVLDDAELLGALLIHLQSRRDDEIRKDARDVGQAKLQASTAPH
ncbi:MAG: conjugal transfer protein TraD [Stenotrophomonas sp.]|uniref:conjugal transfer protein TraD n=1 Tax=Stenotrophomonas sp. TaxID=69392 RepID=UPI0033160CC4